MNLTNEHQKAVTKLRHLLMAPLQIDFVLVNDAAEAVIRELEWAQIVKADYDQRCHDMNILRQAMGCDGSDLPQLLAAWEQSQSSLAQREVQLKKALEELTAEKAVREQAQREREEARQRWKDLEQGLADELSENLELFALLGLVTAEDFGSDTSTKALKLKIQSLIKDRDDLRAKLLASEAGGAEMRELLDYIDKHIVSPFLLQGECECILDDGPCCYCASSHANKAILALSTTCGQSFLAERERLVKALESMLVPLPVDKTRTDEFYEGQINALQMVQEVARTALETK